MNANTHAVPLGVVVRGLSLDQLNLRSRAFPTFDSPTVSITQHMDQFHISEPEQETNANTSAYCQTQDCPSQWAPNPYLHHLRSLDDQNPAVYHPEFDPALAPVDTVKFEYNFDDNIHHDYLYQNYGDSTPQYGTPVSVERSISETDSLDYTSGADEPFISYEAPLAYGHSEVHYPSLSWISNAATVATEIDDFPAQPHQLELQQPRSRSLTSKSTASKRSGSRSRARSGDRRSRSLSCSDTKSEKITRVRMRRPSLFSVRQRMIEALRDQDVDEELATKLVLQQCWQTLHHHGMPATRETGHFQ